MLLPFNKKIFLFNVMIAAFTLFMTVLETEGQSGKQHFISKKFNTENGLCHDYVHWITQDKTGFLWIATWDGVSRFDGYEFRNYFHQPEEKNTLPFFAVNKILVDSLNNVWAVSVLRPMVRYDRARDRFVRQDFCDSRDSVIWDIDFSSDQTMWVLNEVGIFRYDPVTGNRTGYPFAFKDVPERVNFYKTYYQLCRDNKNRFWLCGFDYPSGDYRIIKAELNNDSCVSLIQYGSLSASVLNSSKIGNEILNLRVFNSGSDRTWLFSKFGLYLLDTTQRKFNLYSGPVNPGEYTGKSPFSWMEDTTGLHLIDCASHKYYRVNTQHGNYITSAFLDQSQTIWYGELNQFRENIGLNRYMAVPDYFRHYLTEKDESGNNRFVFPLIEGPDGEIWVGTRYADELFRIMKDGRVIRQSFYDRNMGANHPRIRSMVRDSAGIWMGCTGNFLVRYDFTDRKYTSHKITAKNIEGGNLDLALHNILPCAEGLLINGSEGVYLFNISTGKLDLAYAYRLKASAFCFVKDNYDGYWIGFNGNTIAHLDKNLRETGIYKLGSGFNNVEHMVPGDSSDVWVALMGGGLAHFYPDSSKLHFYTTADGLANNTVYSIQKDRQGNLWISTNQGISRFNPRTGLFRSFRKEDGLLIQEFNSDSWCQASDGYIFFGGVGGMAGFHPDSIEIAMEKGKKAPLVITDLSVSGLPRYFEKAVYEMDTVILQKGDNNCQLKFACIDFHYPEKIRYRYRLSGINDRWTETDYRNREVSYAGLTHKKYNFQVEASDYNGEWISRSSLVIIIPNFYYQTWWFRTMEVLLVIALLLLVIILVFSQIKYRTKQKEGELRLESLRGQMNPHFIFNSLNSINYFISRNDKLSANQYIADFSRLIRAILINLSKDYIPFVKELESLQDYLKLEHLRFSDKFDYILDSTKIDNQATMMISPGMVQPFIENAIWHGVRGLEDRSGFVRIEFQPVDHQTVRCVVEDDGIGRKLSEIFKGNMPGKKSRGIGIVLERLKIINDLMRSDYKVVIGDLYPEREETGTRVIIDIPMKTTEK